MRADHVQDICWVLCLQGSRYENNDIFLKLRKRGPRLCCGDGSVGWLPVLLIVLLLIAQALERAGPRGWQRGAACDIITCICSR